MENQQLKMELEQMTKKFNALRDRTMEKLKYKFNVTILQNWIRKVITIRARSRINWDGVFAMKEREIEMWERRYNNSETRYYELEWKFEKFKQKKRKEKLMKELKTPKIHHLCVRLMCGTKKRYV